MNEDILEWECYNAVARCLENATDSVLYLSKDPRVKVMDDIDREQMVKWLEWFKYASDKYRKRTNECLDKLMPKD